MRLQQHMPAAGTGSSWSGQEHGVPQRLLTYITTIQAQRAANGRFLCDIHMCTCASACDGDRCALPLSCLDMWPTYMYSLFQAVTLHLLGPRNHAQQIFANTVKVVGSCVIVSIAAARYVGQRSRRSTEGSGPTKGLQPLPELESQRA